MDNLHECAISQVSAVLGSPLLTTSRLDLATSGLVIFARHTEAQRTINSAFSDRRVSKHYKALIWGRVEVGEVRHAFRKMRGKAGNPKPTLLRSWDVAFGRGLELSESQNSSSLSWSSTSADSGDWQPAVLNVLECQPFPMAENRRGDSVESPRIHEVTLKLITGRTHQVRLQMAALGVPLVGDLRYLPVAGLLDEGGHTAWRDGASLFGCEPSLICLQACQLHLDESNASFAPPSFQAGTAWWRGEDSAARLQTLLKESPARHVPISSEHTVITD